VACSPEQLVATGRKNLQQTATVTTFDAFRVAVKTISKK
jgi:hypothetical protein